MILCHHRLLAMEDKFCTDDAEIGEKEEDVGGGDKALIREWRIANGGFGPIMEGGGLRIS
ncbi:hypothetical protein U1Q18_049425 [Sarracenia purpurea var. burkii]